MATYDSVRTLPLHVDGYYLEPLEREVARGFTLRRTVIVLHGRGEEGRGEEVDYDPAQQARFQEQGGEHAARGRAHARVVLAAPVGPDRVPALGARVGRARPRAPAGRALARRSGRAHARSRFASWSRPAWPPCRAGSSSTPSFASSSTRAATGRTRSWRRSRRPAGSTRSTSRASSAASSAQPPDADALPSHRRRLPRRMDRRSGAHAGDLGGPRRAPRTHHVGRRDPRMDGRRSAAVRAARAQLQAVTVRIGEAAVRLLRRVRGTRDRAVRRRPVRARARAARRSSCSPPSSTPTRRTTSRRTAST